MNSVLNAFNDIADEYITDALEYSKAKLLLSPRMKRIAAVACVLVMVLSGVGVMMKIWNDMREDVQTPPPVYLVGEKIETYYGVCEYVGSTESTISLKIKSKEAVNETVSISARKWIGKNEIQRCVAVVGSYHEYGPDVKILNNALVIYIDGEECPTLYIPGDGKEHDIVIDFSYLVDNNYEIGVYFMMSHAGKFYIPPHEKENMEGR